MWLEFRVSIGDQPWPCDPGAMNGSLLCPIACKISSVASKRTRHARGIKHGISSKHLALAETSGAVRSLDLQKQRDKFALAMRVGLGKDRFQLIARRLP
jgi:hypothetical protein